MEFPFELIREVNFVRRKVPVPPELRPMQKIAQILLTLHFCCHRRSASVLKLQIFNWAFRSKDAQQSLKRLVGLTNRNDFPIIRFDPALNRAIGFGLAENYIAIEQNTGKISVASKGDGYLASILEAKDLLNTEKELLKTTGRISETAIQNLFRTRFKINA